MASQYEIKKEHIRLINALYEKLKKEKKDETRNK
jgi:hypothetical protein